MFVMASPAEASTASLATVPRSMDGILANDTARETRIAQSPETARSVSGDEQRSPAAALAA
jgi:hypothetical protein